MNLKQRTQHTGTRLWAVKEMLSLMGHGCHSFTDRRQSIDSQLRSTLTVCACYPLVCYWCWEETRSARRSQTLSQNAPLEPPPGGNAGPDTHTNTHCCIVQSSLCAPSGYKDNTADLVVLWPHPPPLYFLTVQIYLFVLFKLKFLHILVIKKF